jgi:uncharacterized RDD family membrane protein YckC
LPGNRNEAQPSEASAVADGSSQELAVSVEGPRRSLKSTAADTGTWPVEQAWRQEVAARVQQHRARRRKRSDPNALELDFPADKPIFFTATPEEFPLTQALRNEAPSIRPEPPRIIRFPRPAPAYTPIVQKAVADELELADPVRETPRILDVLDDDVLDDDTLVQDTPLDTLEYAPKAAPAAQQMELLPSFADIRLDAEESRPRGQEDDWIPRPAPLSQRFVAGLVDAAIVFVATGAFVLTFLKLAEGVPQRMVTLCGLAIAGVLWLLFQYVFLVYARSTPGMHLAQLELAAFEGRPISLFARRSRALASALSCFSLGLGYAWALVDEDRLGWHDRISQTLVQPTPGMSRHPSF